MIPILEFAYNCESMATKESQTRLHEITIRSLPRLPAHFVSGVKWHAAGHIYTPRPVAAIFAVTRRCNARCIMCSHWKTRDYAKELSVSEIKEAFSNTLFESLEKLVITGGEPVLRKDVVQIAQAVLESCPKLKRISLRTNGLAPDLVTEKAKELLIMIDHNNRTIQFTVTVSLDGFGAIHDEIRGVPRAFEMACKTIEKLKTLQLQTPFYLACNCIVQPSNIDGLVKLAAFAKNLEIPINFSPVIATDYFIEDPSERHALLLTAAHYEKMRNVFERELQPHLLPSDIPLWLDYFSIMGGRKKRFPCSWLNHYIRIDSDGTLRICKGDDSLEYGSIRQTPPHVLWYSEERELLKNRLKKQVCPSCPYTCDAASSLSREFFHYASFWLKEKSKLR